MIKTVPRDRELFPSLGPLLCDFIEENMVHGPGDLRGQRVVLGDDWRGLIYRMYEVYPRHHEAAGRRRFPRCGISLPKGRAKTEHAAFLAVCEMHPEAPVRCVGWTPSGEPIGGPVTDPFVVLVAFTEAQSDELCYTTMRVVLEGCPLRYDFDIGLERILRKKGDGQAVSLSAAPSARDGSRTTFSVMDEVHHWTLFRLKQAHQVMLANQMKRKLADPWSLEITTAPEPGAGSIAESTMEYADAIEQGRVTDASLFFFHEQAGDDHDLTTREGARAAVIEASGPAAAWRDIDGIVGLWADPTTDRSYWARVFCNRLVKSATQAFDVTQWRSLQTDANPAKPGDHVVLGFDGSQFFDSTGLVATHVESGFQWCPGLWECPVGRVDWEVPAGEVDACVRDLFKTYKVWRFYCDPPYWQSWISLWIGVFGKERVVEWWTNRRRAMAAALLNYRTAMHESQIQHDGDTRMTRHIANARRYDLHERDDLDRPVWLIRKERPDSPNKIDLAVAGTLSWQARTDAIAAGVANRKRVQVYFMGGQTRG